MSGLPLLFKKFHDLLPGEDFILVNDHDPKPLYDHVKAEYDGAFKWDYLDRGSDVWRVRISRTG